MDTRQGFYSIGVVSEMLGISAQTIRAYEKDQLIHPRRTPGKTRLYSDEDVQRIRVIQNLARDHGVNTAGIRIILQLKDSYSRQLEQIEGDYSEMLEYLMRLLKDQLEDGQNFNPESPVPVFFRVPVPYGRKP